MDSPIRRIAIVNRGDAALRCVRAIRELRAEEGSDLTAIAVYTEPERNAPFVRLADEAISLGAALRRSRGTAPRPAYLDRPRVLAALRATHADAVWPGWGFLAEDPAFVEMLEARDIVFLGPSSATMRALGDKIAAKLLAEKVGVPVAPWSGGPVHAGQVVEAGRRIGFPLLIKASAGGGGRGIRVVHREEDLPAAFAGAVAEAGHAFGDGTAFLEALVSHGRHIEVQIAADAHGGCLALGLRDCSVQRRHQKIIEEAPPPNLPADLASALRDAAVRLAKEADYRGVGTVEFLLGPDGRSYYFLEINPRLQVEHGLTEELTGIDLVKLQIRIARGERLPAAEPAERGHAIEARVCAEDPDAGFMPAPGKVVRLDLPAGAGVRIDCGTALDSVIPAEFDPMIAKVIVHAADREAARARLACALAEFRLVLEGGASNKGFLLDLLDSPEFRQAAVDVAWLDRRKSRKETPFGAQALIVAAILSYLEERNSARLNFLAEAATGAPHSIPPSNGLTFDLSHGGQAYRVAVLSLGDWRYRISCDGRECVATLLDQEPHACQLELNGERYPVTYAINPSSLRVEVAGHPHVIGRDTGGQVRASAPSVVIAIHVQAGERVRAGQRLGLLETMKIEIAFTAPIAGTVREVLARPNERVAAGDVLLVIQPDSDTRASADHTARRLELPAWTDPIQLFYNAEGAPDLAALAADDVVTRESALEALNEKIRRLCLGFDVTPDHDVRLLRILQAPLPEELDPKFLDELAEIRENVSVFAATEVLFSRAPEETADGRLGPSNDARLRAYLRRIPSQGAGIAEAFLERLRRALSYYGVADLAPCPSLERALLRLHAARNNSEQRYRLLTGVLRFVHRLARAGVALDGDTKLEQALTICIALRGEVPEALADAAAQARYTIFELPRIRAQAAAAASAVEQFLHGFGQSGSGVLNPEMLSRIADSPTQIFERIAQWSAAGDQARRDVALQALVLRRYAPLIPNDCRLVTEGAVRIACLRFPDARVVFASVVPPKTLEQGWKAIATECAAEGNGPLVELMVPVEDLAAAEPLRAEIASRIADSPPAARRVCVTALGPAGGRVHLVFERNGSAFHERDDLFGLHPETARRIELDRLREFELERLPAPESVYAFYGRSREIPDDERIFILAEARAAAPTTRGALHEPAFVHVFNQAINALRNIRAERDQRRRLQWNRITIFVRPPVFLVREVLNRMVRELAPLTRHLGLEKVVVRMALREADRQAARLTEIVFEPGASGHAVIAWREPHHAPLRPATSAERRIARARRRGLADPSEVIRLFAGGTETDGAAAGNRGGFEQFEVDGAGQAVPPTDLAEPARDSGIVFGIATTSTEKHPEGMRRVLVVSDPTADMGALAAPECDRIVAALDLAERERLPLEWVAVSSGARISMDSGTENLDATARVVRRIVSFTQGGGEINLVVAGTNVGAQSYFDALATMLMHTRGILIMTPSGAMVLTGRRALEASGGVSAEDEVGIGGYERIMGPSGQAQYYARDLREAYEILLAHYRFTYVAPGEPAPRRHCTADPANRSICEAPYPAASGEGFATVGEIFSDRTNPDRKRPFAMRPLMQAVADADGGWLERWQHMAGAETAIVWDAHIGGHSVCLIGIESKAVPRFGFRPLDGPDQWTGGTLFPLSSKKVARALNAASGNRPVVVLANLSGFDGSPESMRKLQLEYGAEIARAVVNFRGSILFVVVSRYHGGAYVVFSRALNSNLTALALEGSFASVIGGGPAATVVFAREVQARTDADPRVVEARNRLRGESDPLRAVELREQLDRVLAEVSLEKHGEMAREFDAVHSVERAREVGSLDAIIPPAALRPTLIELLDRASATTRKQGTRGTTETAGTTWGR